MLCRLDIKYLRLLTFVGVRNLIRNKEQKSMNSGRYHKPINSNS